MAVSGTVLVLDDPPAKDHLITTATFLSVAFGRSATGYSHRYASECLPATFGPTHDENPTMTPQTGGPDCRKHPPAGIAGPNLTSLQDLGGWSSASVPISDGSRVHAGE